MGALTETLRRFSPWLVESREAAAAPRRLLLMVGPDTLIDKIATRLAASEQPQPKRDQGRGGGGEFRLFDERGFKL